MIYALVKNGEIIEILPLPKSFGNITGFDSFTDEELSDLSFLGMPGISFLPYTNQTDAPYRNSYDHKTHIEEGPKLIIENNKVIEKYIVREKTEEEIKIQEEFERYLLSLPNWKNIIQRKIENNEQIFVFIHIPRTSGSSLKYEIRNSEDSNITYYALNNSGYFNELIPIVDVKKELTPEQLKFVKFVTIVRNPYDRLYSIWKYLNTQKNDIIIEQSYSRIIKNVSDDFADFVKEYCEGYYDPYYFFQPQTYFIKGEELNNIKILKYENREEINQFMVENNLPEARILNFSPEKYDSDYENVYTNELKDLVYEKLEDEFTTLNYSK